MRFVKVTKSCSKVGFGRLRSSLIRWCLLALWCGAGLLLMGCKTTEEPDNEAMTPWNKPKSWETGLPSGMWERR